MARKSAAQSEATSATALGEQTNPAPAAAKVAVGSSGRASLREEQRAVTRKRLMEGALQVFEKTSFTATTVDEIAAAAGVSRATFYLHFRSKLDLVNEVFTERMPEIREYYERADSVFVGGDVAEVEAWMRDAMSYFDRNRTLTFVLSEVLATERDAALEMRVDIPFIEYMPGLMARWPQNRRTEAGARVKLMVWMLDRAWMLWKSDGLMSDVDEDEMVRILADMWLKSVVPPD